MNLFRFLAVAVLAACFAPGCLVGITTADPPAIPKPAPPRSQTHPPVYFRTCDAALPVPCASTPDSDRLKLSLWRVLVAEYGATVQEGDPPLDAPFIAYRFSTFSFAVRRPALSVLTVLAPTCCALSVFALSDTDWAVRCHVTREHTYTTSNFTDCLFNTSN